MAASKGIVTDKYAKRYDCLSDEFSLKQMMVTTDAAPENRGGTFATVIKNGLRSEGWINDNG